MYNLSIKYVVNCILLTLVVGIPTLSHALSKDVEEPVTINADAAEFDRNAGKAAYIGNVVIKQGTLEIKAGRVDIIAPNNEIQTITAAGNPITFNQLMDDGKQASGQAKQMIYQVGQKRLVLTGDAVLMQDRDRFASNRIEYQTNTGQLKAGNATAGAEKQTPDQRRQGRVSATFYPTNKAQ
jgi:lipopolysaccharide export system protein LptA